MYDWKGSLLIMGAFTLNTCVFGALMRPVKRPEMRDDQPILDITPFKKKGYLMLCINNFLFCCGISALYIHLTALSEKRGIDPDRSAMLISGLGIANLVGRFLYGLLASYSYCNVFVLYGGSFLLSGACICVVAFCETFYTMMACAVVFGLLSGCFGTLLVMILIELLGLQRFANGYGCLLLFEAAGQLIGGFLTGAMYDLTESYTLAFVIGGVLCIASAVVMVQPYYYVKNHPATIDIDIPPEKAELAGSIDIQSLRYPSHRDIVQMTVSVESLAAAKRILDIQRSTYSLCTTKSDQTKPFKLINKNISRVIGSDFTSTETI